MALMALLTKFCIGKEMLAGYKERGEGGVRERRKNEKENHALTVPDS